MYECYIRMSLDDMSTICFGLITVQTFIKFFGTLFLTILTLSQLKASLEAYAC